MTEDHACLLDLEPETIWFLVPYVYVPVMVIGKSETNAKGELIKSDLSTGETKLSKV